MRRVWALADTHLGQAMGKTMDRFGPAWENHAAKIARGCAQRVAPDDVLLLPGDLSWAMRRDEAEPDLAFLAALPGIKIAIKGNHDYWWPSGKPLDYPGLHSPPLILDDGALGIAGTRGWFEPAPGAPEEAANRKILERERGRLRRSLAAIASCRVKVAMLHYPPHPYLPDLAAAGVLAVAYGHIHLGSPPEAERTAHDGEEIGGVRCFCVACDRIGFAPRLLGEF
jgi:predicted phosphohydrolase